MGEKTIMKKTEDLITKGLMRVEFEGGNRLLPKFFIDDSLLEELSKPWKDALIIKLLGKTVGYNAMKDRLKMAWKPAGEFKIIDIDKGFFVVKFDLENDREKVIGQCPWTLFDLHYLSMIPWNADFNSHAVKVERTMVWIRFQGLSVVFYDESLLLAMASAVGKPIKVDKASLDRGKIARICVEIDLNLPVVGVVGLRGIWYKVEYEGRDMICSKCCCYGHHSWDCSESQLR